MIKHNMAKRKEHVHQIQEPPISNSITGLELVKAKSAIEQFIYSCSHTLRAPLKSISGLVNLLKNSRADEKIDPELFLQSIESTVQKMETVLNELEQFLCNSRQSVAAQAVLIRPLMRDLLREFQTAKRREGIHIHLRVEQVMPFFTDVNRFQAILSHLISNAVQFSDPAKARKEINIYVRITAAMCTINISDNGVGIPEDVMPRIFELFYRGSEKSTGSGVGLYVVKEILNKISGSIVVHSRVSEGSDFIISIPNLADTL